LDAVEYWNNGILEYWAWRYEICFYMDRNDEIVKSDRKPLLIPNIPFIQYSIIPGII